MSTLSTHKALWCVVRACRLASSFVCMHYIWSSGGHFARKNWIVFWIRISFRICMCLHSNGRHLSFFFECFIRHYSQRLDILFTVATAMMVCICWLSFECSTLNDLFTTSKHMTHHQSSIQSPHSRDSQGNLYLPLCSRFCLHYTYTTKSWLCRCKC